MVYLIPPGKKPKPKANKPGDGVKLQAAQNKHRLAKAQHNAVDANSVQSKQELLAHLTHQVFFGNHNFAARAAEENSLILERERAALQAMGVSTLNAQAFDQLHRQGSFGILPVQPHQGKPQHPHQHQHQYQQEQHNQQQQQQQQQHASHQQQQRAANGADGWSIPPIKTNSAQVRKGRGHVFGDDLQKKVIDPSQVPGLGSLAEPSSPFAGLEDGARSPGFGGTFPDTPSFYPGMVFSVAEEPSCPAIVPQQRAPQAWGDGGGEVPLPSRGVVEAPRQQQRLPKGRAPAQVPPLNQEHPLQVRKGSRLSAPPLLPPVKEDSTLSPSAFAAQRQAQHQHWQQQQQQAQGQLRGHSWGQEADYVQEVGFTPDSRQVLHKTQPLPRVAANSRQQQRMDADARKEAFRLDLEDQIRLKKQAKANEAAALAQAEQRIAAQATAHPQPWDVGARRGGGGEPMRDGSGHTLADLRTQRMGAQGSDSVHQNAGFSQPHFLTMQQQLSHLHHQPMQQHLRLHLQQQQLQQQQQYLPLQQQQVMNNHPLGLRLSVEVPNPSGRTPNAGQQCDQPRSPGVGSPGAQRKFVSDLRAGPSDEQRRNADTARAQLQLDLQEQIRFKAEAKAKAAEAEERIRQKEEVEHLQYQERFRKEQEAEQRQRVKAQGDSTQSPSNTGALTAPPPPLPSQLQANPPGLAGSRPRRLNSKRAVVDASWLDAPPHSTTGQQGSPIAASTAAPGLQAMRRSVTADSDHVRSGHARPTSSELFQPLLGPDAQPPSHIRNSIVNPPFTNSNKFRAMAPTSVHGSGSSIRGVLSQAAAATGGEVGSMLQQLHEEQARMREEFARQADAMQRLADAAARAASDRDVAWSELGRVRNLLGQDMATDPGPFGHRQQDGRGHVGAGHIMEDVGSLDHFVVATHLVPKAISMIPEALPPSLLVEGADWLTHGHTDPGPHHNDIELDQLHRDLTRMSNGLAVANGDRFCNLQSRSRHQGDHQHHDTKVRHDPVRRNDHDSASHNFGPLGGHRCEGAGGWGRGPASPAILRGDHLPSSQAHRDHGRMAGSAVRGLGGRLKERRGQGPAEGGDSSNEVGDTVHQRYDNHAARKARAGELLTCTVHEGFQDEGPRRGPRKGVVGGWK